MNNELLQQVKDEVLSKIISIHASKKMQKAITDHISVLESMEGTYINMVAEAYHAARLKEAVTLSPVDLGGFLKGKEDKIVSEMSEEESTFYNSLNFLQKRFVLLLKSLNHSFYLEKYYKYGDKPENKLVAPKHQRNFDELLLDCVSLGERMYKYELKDKDQDSKEVGEPCFTDEWLYNNIFKEYITVKESVSILNTRANEYAKSYAKKCLEKDLSEILSLIDSFHGSGHDFWWINGKIRDTIYFKIENLKSQTQKT